MKARRLLALLLLAACAQKPPASAPQAVGVLPPERGCAILVGGVGPGFADPGIDQFWFMVNREVTQRLQARLFEKYRAEPLFVEPKDRERTRELVGVEMAKHKCSRILQVAHDVNADGQGAYFRFDITLLDVTPGGKADGGSVVATRSLYEKRYRYARTLEAMKTFSTSGFGDRVFGDLEKSGALEGIRR